MMSIAFIACLTALLSDRIPKDGKYRILKEYEIPLESEMETEVKEMCSLGRGIREKAWEEAKKDERRKNVFRMRSLGWADDQIALALGLALEEVEAIVA